MKLNLGHIKMKSLLIIIALSLITLTGCATSPRPWSTTEKTMLAASCLAMVADTYTTIDMLDRGHYEMNPMMGEYPSNGTVISVMALTQVAAAVLAHYWPAFRTWGLGGKTVFNAGLAFHNTQLK